MRLSGGMGLLLCLSSCLIGIRPQSTESPLRSQIFDSRPVGETTVTEPSVVASASSSIPYQTYDQPNSTVHVVVVPPDQFQIEVTVADDLTPLPELATARNAIAAINAGFFDPQNGLTTSYITVAGHIVADPQQNDRLMQNPDLEPYLPDILNRSEFRVYDCGNRPRYDITPHQTPIPDNCTIQVAVGAGPQLLPQLTGDEEGFWVDDEAGERMRDVLSSQTPNARSAIGIKPDGTVVLAIAQQRPNLGQPSGLTLSEMAEFLQGLGVTEALNLDGGSSTSLYVEGTPYFGKLDEANQPVERPIKSSLYVR